MVQTPQAKEKSEPKKRKIGLDIVKPTDLIKIPHSLNSEKNGYKAIAIAVPFFPSDKRSNVL